MATGRFTALVPLLLCALVAGGCAQADVPWSQRARSGMGLLVMVGLAWLLSTHKRRPPLRVLGWGIGLQLLFGFVVLKTSAGRWLFSGLNDVMVVLLSFTFEGSKFVFHHYDPDHPSAWLSTVAFGVLPTIIFFSSLMAVLYHLGWMQRIVDSIAWSMRRTMRTSGPETLCVAANIFVGPTEAPLVVRPYVTRMTASELNVVMVSGFATVAGGVLAAYVGMLKDVFPNIAGHLIAASVMSAPAALVIAKVLLPEVESPTDLTRTDPSPPPDTVNVIDAAARGAGDGLKLALNVAAMLLAFVALIALVNHLIGLPTSWYNDYVGYQAVEPITIERVLGWLFWPIAFVLGVAVEDCSGVGMLLGEKMVLNEFIAYQHLGDMMRTGELQTPRSLLIATYALCGFANFGSIAIQLGGIGGIAPERRGELARLGLRAMIGGMLAANMTAAVAGLLS